MMKKIIINVFCCLSMLFASSAFAEDSPFLGLWVETDAVMSDCVTFTAFAIRENGTAFWVSDKFYDFLSSPYEDHRYYNWKADGNHLTLISQETNKPFWDLYLFETDHRYLSFLENGEAERFQPVPYVTLSDPSPDSVGPSVAESIPGRWSMYWDARDLNVLLGENRMNFDARSYDFYLYDNGSAYLVTFSMKDGAADSTGIGPGSWSVDSSGVNVEIGDIHWSGSVLNDGRLLLRLSDDFALVLTKQPLFNYEDAFLNKGEE